jgi:hypothetical protein
MTDKPILDGNAAQVRAIIEQTMAAVEAGRGKRWGSVPAWAALILSIVGIVFGAGSLRSDVANANDRIAKLERRADGQDRGAGQVNDRLARIETKLDVVLEKRR